MNCIPEIEDRASVTEFEERPVDPEILKRILEAGRLAPSAKNRQPWRFVVTRDSSVKSRIHDAAYGQDHVGTAPVIISACTTNIDYRMPNGQLSYPIDISFAVSAMMHQAMSEKLGTCIVTTYNEAEMKEILTVPYSMRVVMMLLVGHPKDLGDKSTRKPLNQIVSYEHW